MRAARVLDVLLALQRRGRMTARELAVELEVSARTILRDVEALSEAGVPIFTARGAGGGIELLDGFRTQLTGLTADEARCLFLVGQPQVAHRLGLGAPTLTVRNKLLNALAPPLADQADRLSAWFVHDPDPWTGNRIPHGELRRITRSIHERRQIEITIARQSTVTVQPLGLVLKAGSWQLIAVGVGQAGDTARHDDEHPTLPCINVVCIDELRATRLSNVRFAPPAGFDLTEFWSLHAARNG